MSFDDFIRNLNIAGLADTLKKEHIDSISILASIIHSPSGLTDLNLKAGDWARIGIALEKLKSNQKLDQKRASSKFNNSELQSASELRNVLKSHTIYSYGHEDPDLIGFNSLNSLKSAAHVSFDEFVRICRIQLPNDFLDLANNVHSQNNSTSADAMGVDLSTFAQADEFPRPLAGQCNVCLPPGLQLTLISKLIDQSAAELSQSHLLKRSVVFGFTHPHAYVCIGERDIFGRDPFSLKFTLYGLTNLAAIDRCWAAWNANLNHFSFMSSDGMIAWRALHAQGINPFKCRILLIGRSINCVYAVHLPTKAGDDYVFELEANQTPYVVIKVVQNDTYFASEVAALDSVRPAWYLGCFSHSRQSKLTLPPCDLPAPDIAQDACWWKNSSNLPLNFTGGALFMKHGLILSMVNEHPRAASFSVDKVERDCRSCLKRLHAKGLCHRDVRPSNICVFGDTFELIDFGLAAPANSRMLFSQRCRIQSTWPLEVRDLLRAFQDGQDVAEFADKAREVIENPDCSDEISFIWTEQDDFDMLSKSLCEMFRMSRQLC